MRDRKCAVALRKGSPVYTGRSLLGFSRDSFHKFKERARNYKMLLIKLSNTFFLIAVVANEVL